MSFKDLMLRRRSYRGFEDRPVSKDDLEAISQSALFSPTGMDAQERTFFVIENKAILGELIQVIEKALARKDYSFYNAPVLILVASNPENVNHEKDTGTAIQNMYLMATELGLGGVWINQLTTICQEPDVRRILDKIGVDQADYISGAFALGYPNVEMEEKTRNEKIVFVK